MKDDRGHGVEVPYYDAAGETLDREHLQARQMVRVRQLVTRVLATNRFYGRKLRDAGLTDAAEIKDLEYFQKLPFTYKRELVEDQEAHPPFGTNLTYPLERYVRFHQTSGTTGQPLRWLDTPESWAWWKRCWGFIYRAAGVSAADRVFFAFSFGPFIGFWSAFAGAEALGALTIPGGAQDSVTRLRSILSNGATVLICTPSYALRLGEVAAENDIDLAGSPVRITIHAGEPGASIPATKKRIEEVWGARCFDHYGMTEVGAVSFECIYQSGGIHVIESEYVAEVIDPRTNEPVPPGADGELVLTNLGRTGMPVIRYRTGDRVRANDERCRCGRTFRRLEGGILGRVDDMLTVRGVNVFPSAIENIVRSFPVVDEFMVEVYRRAGMDELRLILEVDESRYGREAVEGAIRGVRESIRQNLNIRVEAEAVPAGSLPRYELKARRVVRRESQ